MDGVYAQACSPFEKLPTEAMDEIIAEGTRTLNWAFKSNPHDGSTSDVKLTEMAAKLAILMGAQLKSAHQSDPVTALSSTLLVFPVQYCCVVIPECATVEY